MNFADVAKTMGNYTYTENGALAYNKTGGGSLLDLFANIGGMRKRDDADIVSQWQAARNENPALADNLILYTRNIRDGGLGERRIARLLLKQLAYYDTAKVIRNFDTIVDCGRWDDLFVFIGTPAEADMWKYICDQFKADMKGAMENKPISLLAKWAPSINTSSQDTRDLAKKVIAKLNTTPRNYRKMLSKLRRYLNILEAKISKNEWDSINFEQVPSLAMKRYLSAFGKHCYEAFGAYKSKLVKGEAKVNAATLYPYDLVEPCMRYYSKGVYDPIVTEQQWKALPNYVDGSFDVVCMADVSGSMAGRPMATSIGLSTYFAQRNKGVYHGLYLTFTNEPHFINLQDSWTLKQCVKYVENTDVGYNTNLDLAFEQIYSVAARTRQVPKALVVISDGEIDRWNRPGDNYCASIAEKWSRKYAAIDLKAPKLILWNCEARGQNKFLAQTHENVAYCSGQSAGTFKNLIDLIEHSAYDAMVRVLSKPEFSWQ